MGNIRLIVLRFLESNSSRTKSAYYCRFARVVSNGRTVAGVLGAYILLFPKGQVRVLMGRGVIPVPALVVIGFWIVLQLVSGVGAISNTAETGGVAYMAHIGGFFAGLILTFVLRSSSTAQTVA